MDHEVLDFNEISGIKKETIKYNKSISSEYSGDTTSNSYIFPFIYALLAYPLIDLSSTHHSLMHFFPLFILDWLPLWAFRLVLSGMPLAYWQSW
jgi:hypothetical protein